MKAFRISILILLVAGLSSVYAQDIITLRSGEQIKAKVTEISTSEIKYKQFEHLEGPTRVVSREDVFAINYENGTREVINVANEISKSQPISEKSNKQNKKNEPQITANPFQGVALGVNVLTGFTFKNSYLDVGFGAKLSYTFSVPIRLAGEFDILWGIPTNETWFLRSRWMDYGVCLQYLFLPGNKRFAIYPLVGIGGVNEKKKVEIKLLGIEEELSINRFAFTLGYGLEGLSKNGKFCYGFGMRIKIANKVVGNNWGYRIHTVVGIGYQF